MIRLSTLAGKPGLRDLGITTKMSLAFAFLLLLFFVIGAVVLFSFLYVNRVGERIEQSNAIVQRVLEMERGMERARRLHGDFFLHYQRIGLQEAHEQYAQPSIREISRVIGLSNDLKKMLAEKKNIFPDDIRQADINLYLAAAKRFADTSIEAVELISARSAPGYGLESTMIQTGLKIRSMLENYPEYMTELFDARSKFKDYLISRKRPSMQSSLNSLHAIEIEIENDETIPEGSRNEISTLIRSLVDLAGDLLELDMQVAGKLNDFSLQAKLVEPVSATLILQTQRGVKEAEKQIHNAYLISGAAIVVSLFWALLSVLGTARFVQVNITRRVLHLAQVARSFNDGHFDLRADGDSGDELGQLSSVFNTMAGQIDDLIKNLEHKVIERTMELSLSEERFRVLVDNLPQIAVQGINEKRQLIYWNATSQSLLGYTHEEVSGRIYEQLIFPQEKRENIKSQLVSMIRTGNKPVSDEAVLMTKDGRDLHVFSLYELQISSKGAKTVYCVHIDLTNLKIAEEKSVLSESYYRQLFDHSSSGVAVFEATAEGEDFLFKDFNRAAERIEKISRDEVVGRSLTAVFPGAQQFGLLDTLKKVWKTGEPRLMPVSLYNDSRIQGWRDNRVYRLPSGEVVAVYNDVSRQKAVEIERSAMELRLQRSQKMEAIGLMAGGVAHDLNNILSAIVGYPGLLLLQLSPDSELRKPLEAIQEAGERAALVVADLLTVARGVASARSSSDINILIGEYFESPEFLQLRTLFPFVSFTASLAEDLPLVDCSPVHVKKCMMNLATNSAEAIELTGRVEFSSRSVRPDAAWLKEHGLEHDHFVILRISDTGAGISTRDMEHIFEPFYTKKVMGKRSGTGLGLTVVWNTLREHGGTVTVSSSGEGTSFELFFPVSLQQNHPQEDASIDEVNRGNGEKILIIDDEISQCRLASEMLDHLGYTTDYVLSGEQALEYLAKNDVDLLILDMLMDPGINGSETFRNIQMNKPHQRAIIASGFSESEDVKKTLSMGAACFLKKPYSLNELGKAVHSALASDSGGGDLS